MSIQIITGFVVNNSVPLDNRIVASGSDARLAIPYKYEGLRVFDTLTERSYYFTNGTFSAEKTDQVNGTTNYIPKFTSQSFVGNSNIYVVGSSGNDDKVGINTILPKESLQIGAYPVAYPGQGMPLTFHKGGNSIIGSNWFYDGADQWFQSSLGSTTLGFGQSGDFSIKVRTPATTFAVGYKQGIYVSRTSKVGIGNKWSDINQPTDPLDVDGRLRVSGGVVSPTTFTFSVVNPSNPAQVIPRFTIFAGAATDFNHMAPLGQVRVNYGLYDSGYFDVKLQKIIGGVVSQSSGSWDLAGFDNINFFGTFSVLARPWSTNGDKSALYLGDTNNYVRAVYGQGIVMETYNDISFGSSLTNTTSMYVKNQYGQVLFRNGSPNRPSISFLSASQSGIYYQPEYLGCPDPDTMILLADKTTKKAKDLVVGDVLHTIHETTKEWGSFEVSYVSQTNVQKKLKVLFSDNSEITVSDSHKFYMGDDTWINAKNLKLNDVLVGLNGNKSIMSIIDLGPGMVIKIEVKDAHTYVAADMISHNIKGPSGFEGAYVFIHNTNSYMSLTTDGNLGVGSFPQPSTNPDRPRYKITAKGSIQSISDTLYSHLSVNYKIGTSTWIDTGSGFSNHLLTGHINSGFYDAFIQAVTNDTSGYGLDVINNAAGLMASDLVLQPDGGTLYSGGGFVAYSDGRFKRDISYTFSYGLNEIDNLKPATFRYDYDKSDKTRLGFIAQDVLEVIPEIVIQDKKNPDIKLGLSETSIIPVLVKAIQELSEKVKKLEGN